MKKIKQKHIYTHVKCSSHVKNRICARFTLDDAVDRGEEQRRNAHIHCWLRVSPYVMEQASEHIKNNNKVTHYEID